MNKLDNCPFCGSEKVKVTSISKNGFQTRTIKYQGMCNKCHARGPVMTITFNPNEELSNDIQAKKDAAIMKASELWNQRTGGKQHEV